MLTLQGLGGVYDEVFLPLHGAHQAQNAAVALAAVEAFLGAGASTRQLDPEVGPGGLRRRDLAGPAGAGAHRADDPARRGAQPARHGRHGGGAAGGVRLRPARRRGRGARRQGRRRACWSCSSRSSTRSSCTRNSSPRAMPADELGELAVEVFGEDRVRVEARICPTRSRPRSTLAESDVDSELAGVGILITGSVVTVADARTLLVR